jgi:hypothetical protein
MTDPTNGYPAKWKLALAISAIAILTVIIFGVMAVACFGQNDWGCTGPAIISFTWTGLLVFAVLLVLALGSLVSGRPGE